MRIDDSDGRRSVSALRLESLFAQRLDDTLPGTVVAPSPELPMHRHPRREVAGQLPPLPTSLHHIKQGVHDTAKLILARTPACMPRFARRFQQGIQQGPLHIRQIARIHDSKTKIETAQDICFGWFLNSSLDRFLESGVVPWGSLWNLHQPIQTSQRPTRMPKLPGQSTWS